MVSGCTISTMEEQPAASWHQPQRRWTSPRSEPGGEDARVAAAAATEDPTPEEAEAWLRNNGLLEGIGGRDAMIRRYKALSRCKFGDGVTGEGRLNFLRRLIPCEKNLAAK